MIKRSLLWAGIAGASLLAAAEPASAPNQANDRPVVTEEETITIVAVPCTAEAAKCVGKEKCDDKDSCDDKKECGDKKTCDDNKSCEDKKDIRAKAAGDAGGCDAAQPAAEFSDADYNLACCFMETSGLPQGFDDANAFMIAEQMDQMPMLQPARPVFEKFFRDHCSYKALKHDLARIHLETFTRDELKKLIDFFNTPEGKKFAASQSELTHRTLALRAHRIHQNLPELQKNVHDCMAKAQPQENPTVAGAK